MKNAFDQLKQKYGEPAPVERPAAAVAEPAPQLAELAELIRRKGVRVYRMDGGRGFKAPDAFRRMDPDGYQHFLGLFWSEVGEQLVALWWDKLPLVRWNPEKALLVHDRRQQDPARPSACARQHADTATAALAELGAVLTGFGLASEGGTE
jgi:hypothetical protein